MMLEWSSDSLEVPFHPFSRDSVWLVQIFLLPWRGSCDTVLCCNVSQIFLNIRITWCLLKNDFWASHTCCSQSPCRGLGTCVFFIFPSWVLLGDLGNTVLTGYTWERPQSKVWHLSLFSFFLIFLASLQKPEMEMELKGSFVDLRKALFWLNVKDASLLSTVDSDFSVL